MDSLRAFFHSIGSFEGLQQLIGAGGLIILVGIVFAETGLLVGFFLPGDSLLITAGFVASTKPELLQLWTLLAALPAAAICGDSTGYLIGRKTGEALYNRPRSRMFHPDKLLRTKDFYDKYGPATVAFARFMPFARTFAPVVAGIAQMRYRTFLFFSVLGSFGWVWSMSLIGFYFGRIPFVQRHMEKVLILVILLSVLPVVLHARRAKKEAAAAAPPSDPA